MSAVDSIFFHELVHFSLSALVGFLFWLKTRDWRLLALAVLAGVFVDVDHWVEYFAYFGPHINLDNFFHVRSYVFPLGKVYVFLHGWELVPLVGWLGCWWGRKLKIRYFGRTVAFAYLSHLLWDQVSFPHSPWGYFFTYRLIHGFSLRAFNGF